MTVDEKRTTKCDWCSRRTNNYDSHTGKRVEGIYCSDECLLEALREKQANCEHLSAIRIEEKDGNRFGVCEECGSEVVEESEWVRV